MAKFPIKLLPLVGVVLLFAAIGFFLIKSEKEDVKELSHNETVPTAGISSGKFNIMGSEPDRGTAWTLEADKGNYEGETALLEGFKFKFQQTNGFDLELEGNSAKYNLTKEEIDFFGGIKGKTANGYMFFTEHIRINLKESSLKTDEDVTFVGPFFKGTGKGLFINMEKEILNILKDVIFTLDKESLTI